MVSLLLYSVGHTDQLSTEWRGTVQGREHQGAGITGGPVGTTHIVTYKLRESKQVSIWKNDWEYSWIQNALPFYLFCYPSKSQGGTESLGLTASTWNIWPVLYALRLSHVQTANLSLVCMTHIWEVCIRRQSQLFWLILWFILCYSFLILFNRKGSGRNWKGHWCWQSPFPHWQGPDAVHRSHHHGGAEADCGGATCHSSYDLRENRQVQCLSPLNALEGIPAFQSKEV